jgi:hypothetical protein
MQMKKVLSFFAVAIFVVAMGLNVKIGTSYNPVSNLTLKEEGNVVVSANATSSGSCRYNDYSGCKWHGYCYCPDYACGGGNGW